jgi:hypothetical protein
VVEKNDLVIATHGRSFYVMEDIGSLRQMKPEVLTSGLYLFQPRTALRSVSPAPIDYYLAKPADKVVIDILDSKGAVVRTYTGTPEDDKAKKGAADDGGDEEFRGPRVGPVPRKAGMNRYSWDLRYPGAHTFEGMILWSARAEQGPLAVPGDYSVRITANGQTSTRPLKVEKDPRLTDVSQADLEEQFQLAMKVRDEVSEADDMVVLIRKAKATADPSMKDRLSTIEEDLYQVRNRSNQDPLNFPIKLNNQIAALQRVIESGDAKPTDQSYIVFKELTARLNALKAKLDEAMKASKLQP